jgi:cell division protein ZapE
MSALLALYRNRIEHGELTDDPAQQRAVAAFQRLHDELLASQPRPGFRRHLARLTGRAVAPATGVYLWGPVGRGKTFLMDLFFASLPFEEKLRRHFHRFMGSVHEDLKLFRHRRNPLESVAEKLSRHCRIICFDEFAVTDIADAMILGNLFTALFERGIALAATSNSHPDALYAGGLQRRRFLPAIEAIKARTEVVHLDGGLDYRLRVLERADVYQPSQSSAAETRLAQYFRAIAAEDGERDGSIDVLGRPIRYRRAADGVIWFEFAEICDGPRSASDYVEISRCYHTVLVSDVPKLDRRTENQARRFIALVDEFYDRRVKLILSAAAPVEALYAGEKLEQVFQRTSSRLEEMQSHDYLAAPHRP